MKASCIRVFALGFVLISTGLPTSADPPVIPPTPPPEIPCAPLVCLQLTDAVEVAPDTWRFEFRSLNWTAFTDRPCPPTDPGCLDRTSPGEDATGLVFVRTAALSTVDFTVLPVDPNGAPLGVEPIMVDMVPLVRLPTGELALVIDTGFIAQVDEIRNALDEVVPPTCYELRDPFEGVIVLFEDPPCDQFVVSDGDEAGVRYLMFRGDDEDPNTWNPTLCTEDQLVWSQDPAVDTTTVIPAGDSNQPTCPVTCEEKESLGNALDGFVIEVQDFQPGDRLVFNWYFVGQSGPIADGSPPTPTDFGTLRPSPRDPWGFSFGSFQIDRQESCEAGDCDTILLTDPPVTDPALNCLVSGLPRELLPFDVYVSLAPAGTDPPCALEPALAADEKGLERLVVRATSGPDTDQVTVVFKNLDTGAIDKTVRLSSLQSASEDIPTDDLLGSYEVSGTCENTATNEFFLLPSFEMAIPRRGDLAELPSQSIAFEIDEAAGTFALTGAFDAGVLDLEDEVDVCYFVQVRDRDGNVRVFGTPPPALGSAEVLTRHDGILVRDLAAPAVFCEPDVEVGTDSDGGADCSVEVDVTAVAADAGGGFTLTNGLEPGAESRSFGTLVKDQEMAFQTATGDFTLGTVPVSFTVTDDAGAQDSCSTSVTVFDDTAPTVECSLLPEGPGNGAGSHLFTVDFQAGDNCDPDGAVALAANIDGIAVSDGQLVRITHRNSGPVEAEMQNGVLHIKTNLGGILEVTGTDAAGNSAVCSNVHPCLPEDDPPAPQCPDVEVEIEGDGHEFVEVPISAADAGGNPLPVTIVSIFQNEAVDAPGTGNTCPDATGIGTGTASVRIESAGGGDGRVYVITYSADDGAGGTCEGTASVCIPRGNRTAGCDDEAEFSSTDCP